MPEIVVAHIDVYVFRRSMAKVEHLMLRRAPRRLYEGTWRMVAGKIEEGEQAWQAAVRELWEETGLAPEGLWAIPSINQFYEWQTDRVQVIPAFAAEVSRDPRLNPEHDAFDWCGVDEAVSRLDWPEQRRLLRTVDEMANGRAFPDACRVPV